LGLGHLVDRLRMFFHGGYPLEPQDSHILPDFLASVKPRIIALRKG
jgi:hypothetical protein